MPVPFELIRNDITRMRVDAIVNAANNTLLGGGGVDGAIHRAAGPQLLAECRTLGGCPTGEARITGGYRLPCRYVIHTVGPIWQGGGSGEKDLLVSCYLSSLRLAADHGCETVAFPLISAGVYGYPKDQAIRVASDTIRAFLADHDMTVYLVIYDFSAYVISQTLYNGIRAYISDAEIPAYVEEEESLRKTYLNSPAGARKKEQLEINSLPPHPKEKKRTDGMAAPSVPFMACDEADASSASLDEYLAGLDEGFRDMLLRKIDEENITDAACYKRANVDRKLFNKIKNQPDYRPGKSTVLAFAVALRLPLPEIREMLAKAGFSLTHSSKADLIVEYFVLQGIYDVFTINEALFSFDQKLLGSA